MYLSHNNEADVIELEAFNSTPRYQDGLLKFDNFDF